MNPEEFLNQEEEKQIIEAIRKAEKNTSGEIRVHLEMNNQKPSIERAWEVFDFIGMDKTERKNGILFYVDVEQHVFSIIGDTGIDKLVPEDFWDSIKNRVVEKFKDAHYAQGLIDGIEAVGHKLKKYFPYQSNDINELPDEISKNF